jgi:hypothetical protein
MKGAFLLGAYKKSDLPGGRPLKKRRERRRVIA